MAKKRPPLRLEQLEDRRLFSATPLNSAILSTEQQMLQTYRGILAGSIPSPADIPSDQQGYYQTLLSLTSDDREALVQEKSADLTLAKTIGDRDSLTTALQNTQLTVSALQNSLGIAQTQSKNLPSTLDALSSQLTGLQSQKNQTAQDITATQGTIATLLASLASLQNQQTDRNAQLKAVQDQLPGLQQALSALDQALQTNANAIAAANAILTTEMIDVTPTFSVSVASSSQRQLKVTYADMPEGVEFVLTLMGNPDYRIAGATIPSGSGTFTYVIPHTSQYAQQCVLIDPRTNTQVGPALQFMYGDKSIIIAPSRSTYSIGALTHAVAKNTRLPIDKAGAQTTINSLQTAAADLAKQRTAANDALTSAMDKNTTLQQSLATLQASVTQTKSDLDATNVLLASRQKDWQDLSMQIESVAGQISTAQAFLAVSQQTINDLTSQLATAQAQESTTEESLARAQSLAEYAQQIADAAFTSFGNIDAILTSYEGAMLSSLTQSNQDAVAAAQAEAAPAVEMIDVTPTFSVTASGHYLNVHYTDMPEGVEFVLTLMGNPDYRIAGATIPSGSGTFTYVIPHTSQYAQQCVLIDPRTNTQVGPALQFMYGDAGVVAPPRADTFSVGALTHSIPKDASLAATAQAGYSADALSMPSLIAVASENILDMAGLTLVKTARDIAKAQMPQLFGATAADDGAVLDANALSQTGGVWTRETGIARSNLLTQQLSLLQAAGQALEHAYPLNAQLALDAFLESLYAHAGKSDPNPGILEQHLLHGDHIGEVNALGLLWTTDQYRQKVNAIFDLLYSRWEQICADQQTEDARIQRLTSQGIDPATAGIPVDVLAAQQQYTANFSGHMRVALQDMKIANSNSWQAGADPQSPLEVVSKILVAMADTSNTALAGITLSQQIQSASQYNNALSWYDGKEMNLPFTIQQDSPAARLFLGLLEKIPTLSFGDRVDLAKAAEAITQIPWYKIAGIFQNNAPIATEAKALKDLFKMAGYTEVFGNENTQSTYKNVLPSQPDSITPDQRKFFPLHVADDHGDLVIRFNMLIGSSKVTHVFAYLIDSNGKRLGNDIPLTNMIFGIGVRISQQNIESIIPNDSSRHFRIKLVSLPISRCI